MVHVEPTLQKSPIWGVSVVKYHFFRQKLKVTQERFFFELVLISIINTLPEGADDADMAPNVGGLGKGLGGVGLGGTAGRSSGRTSETHLTGVLFGKVRTRGAGFGGVGGSGSFSRIVLSRFKIVETSTEAFPPAKVTFLCSVCCTVVEVIVLDIAEIVEFKS